MKVLIVGGLSKLREGLLMGKNVHVKYVTCGRPNCACHFGRRHGPYYYHRRRTETGRYIDVYLKSSEVNFELNHEIVGDSLLMNVARRDQIPSMFNTCPIFVVDRKISINRSEQHSS